MSIQSTMLDILDPEPTGAVTVRSLVIDALCSVENLSIIRRIQAAEDKPKVAQECLKWSGFGAAYGTHGWAGENKGLEVKIGENVTTMPWKEVAAIAMEIEAPLGDILGRSNNL